MGTPARRLAELAVLARGLRRSCSTAAEELEVEQDQLHRRVADALADAERGAVDAIGAELERPEGVDEREAAIVVAVPVDADVGAGPGDERACVKLDAGCARRRAWRGRRCRRDSRREAPCSMAIWKSGRSISGASAWCPR